MMYLPSLYDYSWDVTILEVGLCPHYQPMAFIQRYTGMMPFSKS
jgi:hypothetical protein